MATNTLTEWHPHLGSIWQRAIGLWEGYIGDATVTWAALYTTVSSHWCWQITLTGAVDTNVYKLVDGGRRAADFQPVQYIDTLPGWRAMPKAQAATQAGRTSDTDWNTNMVAARAAIWVDYDNGDTVSYTLTSKNLTSLSMVAKYRYAVVRYDNDTIFDVTCLITATQTATEYLYNGYPVTSGVPVNVLAVLGGAGGGGVDLSGVVAAINEVANADPEYVANNGANIFSMRSRVRTGP